MLLWSPEYFSEVQNIFNTSIHYYTWLSEVQNIFNTSIHNYTCFSEIQNICLKSSIFLIPQYITKHASLGSRIFVWSPEYLSEVQNIFNTSIHNYICFSEVQNIFNTSIHNYTCFSEVQNIFNEVQIHCLKSKICFLKSRIFIWSPEYLSEVQNIFNTSIHNYTCFSEFQNIFLKSRIFLIPQYTTTHAFLKSRIFFWIPEYL